MDKYFINLIVFISLLINFSLCAEFRCPEEDGPYEDPVQCDKYWECSDGVATPKLCPDGLVFDKYIRKINKCDQPVNVDCENRYELQPPQPKGLCPRRNGYFAHQDPTICDRFYNCIEGELVEQTCTPGLFFDESTALCVWPDQLKRPECKKSSLKSKDGFECPKETQFDERGQVAVHPKFAHPTDCQKFYVCLNGVEPRDLGCTIGEVYNEDLQKCDAPENVRGCEDWYKEEDLPPKTGSKKN